MAAISAAVDTLVLPSAAVSHLRRFVGQFVEGFVVLVEFVGKVGSRRLFVDGLA
jgi:hypothetical protein